MTPALVMFLGAAVFIEQELPGLRVGEINPFTGEPAINFRRADMDGDGALDLLLPEYLYFQRNGEFPAEEAAAIPHQEQSPIADLFDGLLYLRLPDRIACYEWRDGAWHARINHEVSWPPGSYPGRGPGEPPGVRYSRFLHDFDGDGVAEILAANAEGLHIFRQSGEVVFRANTLNVFPPLELMTPLTEGMWPPEKRKPMYPPRHSAFELILDGPAIHVLTRHPTGGGAVYFRRTTYHAPADGGFELDPTQTTVWESAPVPEYLRPCRLNATGELDFAGTYNTVSQASPVPVPIFETTAALNGGATVQSIRSRSFRPRCFFADMNGNGDLDLITESTLLFAGGLRETLSRFFTKQWVDHEIRVHLQTPDGFDVDNPIRGRFRIRLDETPHAQSERFRDYRNGRLVDVTGDFNGDGLRDIAIHDLPGRLAIYLAGEDGFASEPAITFPMEHGWRFAVADVDGDGRSDVIMHWNQPWRDTFVEVSRVYLNREQSP